MIFPKPGSQEPRHSVEKKAVVLIGGGFLAVIAIVNIITAAADRATVPKEGQIIIAKGATSSEPFSDWRLTDVKSASPNTVIALDSPTTENQAARVQADAEQVKRDLRLAPYFERGAVTGLSLQSFDASGSLGAIGLRQGDVIVEIDGEPIRSMDDAEMFRDQIYAGGLLSFVVARAGTKVHIAIAFNGDVDRTSALAKPSS